MQKHTSIEKVALHMMMPHRHTNKNRISYLLYTCTQYILNSGTNKYWYSHIFLEKTWNRLIFQPMISIPNNLDHFEI